ncbi:MAG: BMP family ABC transporter substrate-binding protein [Treponemataceae bacterium]|nr:BMP family ABC transporter substrate-binding protein [Treponemataceae bacterium]
MKHTIRTFAAIAAAAVLLSAFTGCAKKDGAVKESIAVYIPGVTAGSPTYEQLAAGVTKAVNAANASRPADNQVSLAVIEAGTNQAEWGNKITALAASGDYTLIISSNPSLPELVEPLTTQFPAVKFIILDSYLAGNPNMATVQYNQREQAYLAGYSAGLAVTAPTSQMQFADGEKKVALIAAQEYPVMNNVIFPAFAEGAKAVDPEIEVLFRVVGNWYDASKGSELARAAYKEGVRCILPICGGASQGVIAAAQELGFYINWFDADGFDMAPGYVISSTLALQETMAAEITTAYLNGTVAFGTARNVGIKDGYVAMVRDNPLFAQSNSAEIQAALNAEYQKIIDGTLVLSVE